MGHHGLCTRQTADAHNRVSISTMASYLVCCLRRTACASVQSTRQPVVKMKHTSITVYIYTNCSIFAVQHAHFSLASRSPLAPFVLVFFPFLMLPGLFLVLPAILLVSPPFSDVDVLFFSCCLLSFVVFHPRFLRFLPPSFLFCVVSSLCYRLFIYVTPYIRLVGHPGGLAVALECYY